MFRLTPLLHESASEFGANFDVALTGLDYDSLHTFVFACDLETVPSTLHVTVVGVEQAPWGLAFSVTGDQIRNRSPGGFQFGFNLIGF